ncbi:MAG TPA: secondary thiamine-phosphate synthase enzyme YjbQ [Actinomycetota bacterium]|nr:secondary thiamine-phosphate synthase enzyme YjbQ [Actinomycetota bacterium]
MIVFEEFETKTGGRLDALDVTAEVVETLESSGIKEGTALVFSPHTTCCVLVSERGTQVIDALERTMSIIAPEDGYYAHDDLDIRTENLVEDEPANAPAHIAHAFLGKSAECIPISRGALALGDDQRVLFVELDSSRARRYYIQILGE